jgi:hypothetical protein
MSENLEKRGSVNQIKFFERVKISRMSNQTETNNMFVCKSHALYLRKASNVRIYAVATHDTIDIWLNSDPIVGIAVATIVLFQIDTKIR